MRIINTEKFIKWLEKTKEASMLAEENAAKSRDYATAHDEMAAVLTLDFVIDQLTDNADEQEFWEEEE